MSVYLEATNMELHRLHLIEKAAAAYRAAWLHRRTLKAVESREDYRVACEAENDARVALFDALPVVGDAR